MSYGLINGSAINSTDGGSPLVGLDLVVAGTAAAVYALDAEGALALDMGDVDLAFAVGVDGVDLVVTETHTGLYNALLFPAGLDLVSQGEVTMDQIVDAASGAPMELGTFRAQNGVDVVLELLGMDPIRTGLANALAAQPAPNVAVEVSPGRPMQLGAAGIQLGTVTVEAGSHTPLQLGAPSTAIAVAATSGAPVEMGEPGSAVTAVGAGSFVIAMGSPVLRFTASVSGIDLVRPGAHSTFVPAISVVASSANPIELGTPSSPATNSLYAHQAFPLQMGWPTLDRGTAC